MGIAVNCKVTFSSTCSFNRTNVKVDALIYNLPSIVEEDHISFGQKNDAFESFRDTKQDFRDKL